MGPRTQALVCTAAGLVLRAGLILRWPTPFWHDGYRRLSHARQLVHSVWLPGYQILLGALSLVTRAPVAHRLLTASLGAAAAGVACLLARRLRPQSPTAGWLAGLGLAVGGVFLFEGVGLYQEPLFDLLWLSGLLGIGGRMGWWEGGRRGQFWPGVAALMAATATRYEGWLLVGWLGLLLLRPGNGAGTARRALLAWAAWPLGWLLWWRGLSPIGADSLSVSLAPARLGQQIGLWGEVARAGWLPLSALLLLPWALRGWRRPRPMGWLLLLWTGSIWGLLAWARPFHPLTSPRTLHLPLHLLLWSAVLGCGGAGSPRGHLVGLLSAALWLPSGRPLLALLRAGAADPAVQTVALVAESGLPLPVAVLAPGWPDWPEAEPAACQQVMVALRAGPAQVRCDAALGPDARATLCAEGVQTLLVEGHFTPWRPSHLALPEAFSEEGAIIGRLRRVPLRCHEAG